jgi:hypothetical protein
VTEVRVENRELLDDLKKKLQWVAYDLWFKTLKGTDKLYVVETFDLKTVEEDISPEHRAYSRHFDSNNPMNTRGSQKMNQFSLMNSPSKNFTPKRKMFDLYNIRNF